MARSSVLSGVFALGLLGQVVNSQTCPTCNSYGLDYMNGGSYFQNTASSADFTAYENFQGCQNDTANNFLIDPNGVQYQCNDVSLQPDNTTQLVTCPLQQSQMFSGEWSIVVISNNGDCAPIDNIRTFSISAGVQSTQTLPPTITLTATTTPVVATNITTTATFTSTAAPSTITVQKAPTTTVTRYPLPTISVSTRAVFTQTFYSQYASVISTTTATRTASCKVGGPVRIIDPTNTGVSITATGGAPARRTAAPVADRKRSGSTEWKRADAAEKQQEQQKRAVAKRHPDQPTTTVVGTGVPVTVTTTQTAAATTVTGTSTVITFVTSTPTVTVTSGGGGVATVTAPRSTITNVLWIPVTFVTKTTTTAVVITKTTTVRPTSC